VNHIEFHPEALAEAEAAIDWYQARSERAASRFVDELRLAVTLIGEAPNRWPLFDPPVRKLLLNRFPYAVMYRETSRGAQIVAVAHMRRQPGYWRDRLH